MGLRSLEMECLADRVKHAPRPYVLPRQIWSFFVKRCRHKYRRIPKIGERLNYSLSLGIGAVADPKIHAPPDICYLPERGRSALKGVVII